MNRRMGMNIAQSKARRERKGSWYPKGFDITLADAMSELNLNMDQIKILGDMTKDRKIASATIGQQVFYRRRTLQELFPVVHSDELTHITEESLSNLFKDMAEVKRENKFYETAKKVATMTYDDLEAEIDGK